MNFGLFSINAYAAVEPRTLARMARAAEAAGFESLWAGEHVVLPDPQAPPSPMAPTEPILDPAIALTYAAAVTTRVRLGTGIIILPQRNPLVLAKEIASLDVLSGGRALLGVGAGYLHQEFRALGVPFADRGARTDESIDAMRALWTMARPAFHGRYVSFSGVEAQPRPVQRGGVPIVVGGTSPGALRRAVQRGNGWYGFAMDPGATEHALRGLEKARSEVSRPAALGPLEISVTPPPGLDADGVRRYAGLGVDRLVLLGLAANEERLKRLIGDAEAHLLPAAR